MPKTSQPPAALLLPGKRAKSFEPLVASAFGTVVRALRMKRGIAQDQFALLANVDRSYFGKLERGERQPSLGLLLRISGALHVTGAEIVKRVETRLKEGGAEEV